MVQFIAPVTSLYDPISQKIHWVVSDTLGYSPMEQLTVNNVWLLSKNKQCVYNIWEEIGINILIVLHVFP